MSYSKSSTKVSDELMRVIRANGIGSEWTHPRTGKTRVYLNESDLARVIGLDQTYYKSGNVSGCHYVDGDGDRVSVAHSRAWGRYNKCYVEDGTVWCDWAPYGADIAELVATRLADAADEEAA